VVQARKVAVLGAAGGIGQPLSLLLKMNKCVTELALFDVAPVVKGVAADLSHCNTPVLVGVLGTRGEQDRQAGASLRSCMWCACGQRSGGYAGT
jgi:malate/lactate dehydrogenase